MSLFKKLFGKKENTQVQVEVKEQEAEVREEQVAFKPYEEEAMEASTLKDPVEGSGDEVSEIEESLAEETDENQDACQAVNTTSTTDKDEEESELIENQVSYEENVRASEEEQEKERQEEAVEPKEAEEVVTEEENEVPQKQGFIKRLFSGLSKTRDNILKGVDDVLSSFKHIDEELYEELEEALIMADFGVDTTLHIMEKLKNKVKEEKISDPSALKPALQEIITSFLTDQPTEDILNPEGPTVVLVIGVNGVGKTTSIGKMSHLYKSMGKRVVVAAADTFRAAAIEQLNVWTERAGVEIIKHEEGSDAAAVVFDAITAAKSRKADVLICDTAGRLQNKTNLMKELEKISRIITREYPEAKREILIVIDATTGQNALQQVKLFKEVADISGIILTKLDGTAKGGAIVGIYESLKVPVKYIGVGEKIDDLQPFDAQVFARALFEKGE